MEIILAASNQYEEVRAFYHSLIDAMESSGSPYLPGWKKDIYPSPEFLMKSITCGELYIGCENHKIVSSMVLNQENNEGYSQFQ